MKTLTSPLLYQPNEPVQNHEAFIRSVKHTLQKRGFTVSDVFMERNSWAVKIVGVGERRLSDVLACEYTVYRGIF